MIKDIKCNGIVTGNHACLKAVMKRATLGEHITVGAIGGSITQGAKADSSQQCYFSLTADWWRKNFPKADVAAVNAGIGATNSSIGVFRLGKDLLATKPDFVIVEYAVNDAGGQDNTDLKETYENIVRRCLTSGAAVLLLFLPRQIHANISEQRSIGCHYRLPMISIVDLLEPQFDSGTMKWEDYGADHVHPNTAGHKLIADTIIGFLESVFADRTTDPEYTLPGLLTSDIYMNAEIFDSLDLTPVNLGSFHNEPSAFEQFPNGWVADQPGAEPIVFELECRTVQLLYRRSIDPGYGLGRAVIEVNGERHIFSMNGYFKDGWGDYACSVTVFHSSLQEKIRISVYATEGVFALLRIMTAG